MSRHKALDEDGQFRHLRRLEIGITTEAKSTSMMVS